MNKNKTEYSLGTEKISKLIFTFSLTTLAALVFNAIYTLTDTLFVSRCVGDVAMGGVSVVFPFTVLQGALSTAVGGGAASIVSRLLGENKHKEAGEITVNAMVAFYVCAIAVSVLGLIFMKPMLRFMGVNDEIYQYSRDYFTIILAGNIFSTGFSSIIRAEGKMTYGLLIWIIPVSVNIILDAVLVMGLDMGVKGSAIATVICQFISFSMSIFFFTRFTVQKFVGAKPDIKCICKILAVGIPSLAQLGSISVVTLIMNNVLSDSVGTVGITAFAYISKVISFGIIPFTAVAQAIAPVAGYNFGAGNTERVKKSLHFSILICILYSIIVVPLFQVIPDVIIGIFTDNAEVLSVSIGGLRIISISLLFVPVFMIVGAMYQAMGKIALSLLLYCSNMIFLVPFMLLAGKNMNMTEIWIVYTASCFFGALLAAVVFLFEQKRA